ncbi:hypothetical protein ABK040_011619 [Willaertia magna]
MNISFIDETDKTKDKQSRCKVLSLIMKNQKKSRLRKQLCNKVLLQNYFEWQKTDTSGSVVKYKLNKTENHQWISVGINTVNENGLVKKEEEISEEKQNQPKQQGNRILVSDYFGLKLDVDDFILTYEKMLAVNSNRCQM